MKTNDTAATPGQSPGVSSPSLFQSVQAHARPRYSQPLPLSRRAARKGFGPSKTPGTPYVRDPFAGASDLPGNASGLYPGQSFRRVEPLTYSEKVAAAVSGMPIFGTFYSEGNTERGQGCLNFPDNPKTGERNRSLSGVYSRADLLAAANGAPVFDISGASFGDIFRIGDLPLFQRAEAWRAIFCPELTRATV